MLDADLIDKKQAARLLSVSPQTVQYWVNTGRLAPTVRGRRGRSHLFRRTDAIAASSKYRIKDLKSREGEKNFLTVPKVASLLGISRTAAYGIVTRYKPTKYHVGSGRQYFIDGEELYHLLQESPYYSLLMELRRV